MGRWAAYRLLRRLTSLSSPSSIPSHSSIHFISFSLLRSSDSAAPQFHRFRPFSYAPSSSYASLAHNYDYGIRDFNQSFVDDNDDVQSRQDEEEQIARIPVKAFFLSTRFVIF